MTDYSKLPEEQQLDIVIEELKKTGTVWMQKFCS